MQKDINSQDERKKQDLVKMVEMIGGDAEAFERKINDGQSGSKNEDDSDPEPGNTLDELRK